MRFSRRPLPVILLLLALAGCSFLEEAVVPSVTGKAPPSSSAPPGPRPRPPQPGPLDPEGPYLLLRFGQPPPDWRGPLALAARKALEARPEAHFEVASLAPGKGLPVAVAEALAEAGQRAEEIYRALRDSGVPADRIALVAASRPDLALPEVRIYLR